MNTVTHALLPVIAAAACESGFQLFKARRNHWSCKQLLLIGLFGAAPDLLNPHLSLEARYTSWSHSIWFWAALSVLLYIFTLAKRHVLPLLLTFWLSFGYLAHIVLDGFSGGIAWNYPWHKGVIGEYYINPVWWVPVDVGLFIIAYFLLRIIPKYKERRLNNPV